MKKIDSHKIDKPEAVIMNQNTRNVTKNFWLALLLITLVNCTKKEHNNDTKPIAIDKKIPTGFHKLQKLSVTGDFDGDQKTDTIYQQNFSKLQKKEIEFAPSPYEMEWDEVVKWFFDQDADVNLRLNHKSSDAIHLGTAQGLYCLINIGDNNNDGKDEIAFAVDQCDQSRINTCQIYALCSGKWQLLKEFGIREDAFDWKKGETQPKFNSIKGYLEQQNNVWKYLDNNQQEYDSPEEVGQMKVLKLGQCHR